MFLGHLSQLHMRGVGYDGAATAWRLQRHHFVQHEAEIDTD